MRDIKFVVVNGWAAFQQRHGLKVDGIPGANTLAEVESMEHALGFYNNTRGVPGPLAARIYTFGGEEIRKGISRDPLLLLPGFADKVERLFQALRDEGHEPMLWEGYRTPERALKLNKRGTGIKQSMHCLGAAVDIVDEEGLWDASPAFWDAIGEEAEELGLTVLYRDGQRIDRPHVQAIPVSEQKAFRAMTEDQRRERVA